MKPTDDEVNRLCAEACGYTCQHADWLTGHYELVKPDGLGSEFAYKDTARVWKDAPNFCADRNALPELLLTLKDPHAPYYFGYPFCRLIGVPHTQAVDTCAYKILMTPPRTVAIAALKSLSRWPDSWETEESE